jgi:hypothetical protein
VEGDQVVTERFMNGIQAPPFWQMALRSHQLPSDQPVDRWQICRFTPPSHVMIEVGVALAGQGGYHASADRKVSSIVVDFITPESDTSMWYFWGMARNFRADDKALTAQIREGQGKIFSEDLQVLELQQRNLLQWPGREVLKLNIDAGGVQARKVIDRLLAAERRKRWKRRHEPAFHPARGARHAQGGGGRGHLQLRAAGRGRAAAAGLQAGSHVDVQLPGGLVRPYSLCNDPAETHRYLIAVLRDAASRGGSVAMHERVHEGDVLTISAPKNHFALAHDATEHLLLAGGIGITPLLCMAERLAVTGADFALHYATRSRARTAFADRIAASSFAPACTSTSTMATPRSAGPGARAGGAAPRRPPVCLRPAGLHGGGARRRARCRLARDDDRPHHAPVPRRPCRQLPAPGLPARRARAVLREEGDHRRAAARGGGQGDHRDRQVPAGRRPAEHHRRRVPPHLFPHRLSSTSSAA